jgi:hypothetical protein
VAQQKYLCSLKPPQQIIGLRTLKSMYVQVRKANEEFELRLQMMTATSGPQQGLTGTLMTSTRSINRLFQLTTPNVPSAAQPTPLQTLQTIISHSPLLHSRPRILIPDLTALITRCVQDPVCGGTYGNIYRCIYHGPEGNVEVVQMLSFFHVY